LASPDPIHEAIRRSAREFTDREVVPHADRLDNEERPIPDELIAKLGELGYLGLTFPPEHGGSGMGSLAMAVVTEELARGWLSVGSVMTRAIITGTLIRDHGTDEQKRRYLPAIASGAVLTAAAFTEPDFGSDLGSCQLRATRSSDGYVLDGAKTWCTFADRAHLLTILARTDPDPASRHRGLSILLIEKEPGAGFQPPALSGSAIPTIGYRGVTSYALSFEGLRAPRSALLGQREGQGFAQLMSTFELARIQTAARAVGVARAALEAAIAYARQRVQFGGPLTGHQVIRHKIARMATELEAARQLCHAAAVAKDAGGRSDLPASHAKAFAAEMAERVTSEALQVFGGYGYSREFPVQRFWRDARVFRIFEGTSEIQYEVIAKRLLDE
jgi:(2S)-methylsuccinyl-CoA dehydrogenase